MQQEKNTEIREKQDKKSGLPHFFSETVLLYGRSDWIRTSGHLNPIQVLYQTEPHPVNNR